MPSYENMGTKVRVCPVQPYSRLPREMQASSGRKMTATHGRTRYMNPKILRTSYVNGAYFYLPLPRSSHLRVSFERGRRKTFPIWPRFPPVFWLPPFHFISPVFIMNILPSPFGIISDDKRRKLIRIHSGGDKATSA